MKGVQCYELFGGIALKIHTFSFSMNNVNRVLNILPQYRRKPREPSLRLTKQIGMTFVQKLGISVKYILKETLIFTQLATIIFLFKQLKT